MTSFKLDKEDSIQQRKLLVSFGQALAAKGASVVLTANVETLLETSAKCSRFRHGRRCAQKT